MNLLKFINEKYNHAIFQGRYCSHDTRTQTSVMNKFAKHLLISIGRNNKIYFHHVPNPSYIPCRIDTNRKNCLKLYLNENLGINGVYRKSNFFQWILMYCLLTYNQLKHPISSFHDVNMYIVMCIHLLAYISCLNPLYKLSYILHINI